MGNATQRLALLVWSVHQKEVREKYVVRVSLTKKPNDVIKQRSMQALCNKMEGLGMSSQKSAYLRGSRSVATTPRLVASNTPCNTASVGRGRGRMPLKIVTARVAGVEIPNAKRLETSLTYVYGIGPTTAKTIMTNTGDLRRFTAMNIKRLIDIQCYRGKRHQMSLPVRGQKTKTNARTRKGKKKTVAGKKK